MELIALVFFIVAFIYSSVGHGGASSYLALLALLNYPTSDCKSSALILNIVVAGIAFVNFIRVVKFQIKPFIWLILGSIPASFLGSKILLDPSIYKLILGFLLIISALRLFEFASLQRLFHSSYSQTIQSNTHVFLPLFIGMPIGLISGMIGIGGGIILSPILLLLRWHDAKETAALSSGFIVVNSIAGLLGNPSIPKTMDNTLIWILIASVVGGILGSLKGAKDFSNSTIKRVLAVVLIVAAVKLIGGIDLLWYLLFL